MNTREALRAAQTARALARLNFSQACERALSRALAAGVRGVLALDEATEADDEVIEARAASASAIEALKAAEAAASAAEREALESHATRSWTSTYGEGGDRPDPDEGME